MIKNLSKIKFQLFSWMEELQKKVFLDGKNFQIFQKKYLVKFLALPQNDETMKYLKNLGVKKVKLAGNLNILVNQKKL